jgi:hypothetical protein
MKAPAMCLCGCTEFSAVSYSDFKCLDCGRIVRGVPVAGPFPSELRVVIDPELTT